MADDAVQPLMAPPWAVAASPGLTVTLVLVGINIAVFIGMALAGVSVTDPTSQQLIHWGADYGPKTLNGQWWRLLTSTFVHIGVIHILFNMWCLWDLGGLAETLYGRATYAAIYLVSGVGASIASLAWNSHRVSAGASGAIFGVAGALIASFYLGEFSLPRSIIQSKLRSLLTFAGYNLLFGAVSGRTDNAAHLGGLVVGLVFGALVARVAANPAEPVRRATVAIVVALAVLAGGGWLRQARLHIVHTERGNALLQDNKVAEAISEFEAALRIRPDYSPARSELSYAYVRNGQRDKAEMELNRLLEIEPKNEWAYFTLGSLQLEAKRLADARGTFSKLQSIDPKSSLAHFGLGMVAASETDYAAAVNEYKTAAQLDNEIEGLYYNTGLAMSQLKMYDDAIDEFIKEREENGDSAENERALARAYRGKGLVALADEAQKKAAELEARR